MVIGTDEVVYRKCWSMSRRIDWLPDGNIYFFLFLYITSFSVLFLTILKDQSKNVKMQETVNRFINNA